MFLDNKIIDKENKKAIFSSIRGSPLKRLFECIRSQKLKRPANNLNEHYIPKLSNIGEHFTEGCGGKGKLLLCI